MPLHLIKLAVGVRDLDHLAELQDRRAVMADGQTRIPVYTRRLPKRGDELLAGGSIYWVIKGSVLVRQPILAIDTAADEEGESYCTLQIAADRVQTVPTPHRPFQGWRYLTAEAAPQDLSAAGGAGDELPADMAAELRALGLL
ncbi:hypothetical protein TSH7_21545 [Azospirillum sp. TSH7]|uniref:DUF1489 family protein n=1 Tax=unclassified Azospirillum TaxID=2630922 RepID=UPI000D61A952|nr:MULTISPECIES: DUF1489 domain-containing protein [unclassified Azospirillum]PWC57535.1 hypothetical protein TSH20_31020 [Azospirillum sp. TSH20]PWC59001.1 hypothetical protein TSH7_21545 [Azospirillum sp. TSH7]